jgi:hypothetical protein
MSSTMLERATESGRAPTLALLMDRGVYVRDCVAAFPSVTPVCAATIATGVAQDRHLIPSMNWYHRGEGRYVEYGSSMSAARRFGIARQLTDTVYNMNRVHLSPDVLTVFETLDDAQWRTAGTTYLMYRGRHRHEPARDSALTLLASTLFPHSVMGPREFFYADIFSSRRTGCRSQLGMPGIRDQHGGCVGAYLVEHDLFDFLLLSLPDNDTYSHRRGPEAQEESIAHADSQLARLVQAAGGADEFLAEHAVIVMADHSHAQVEQATVLEEAFGDFIVLQPAERRTRDAEIAVCPAQRSAMIYVLVEQGRRALLPRLVSCALKEPAVDLVMWREGTDAVITSRRGELRFAPAQPAEPRGAGASPTRARGGAGGSGARGGRSGARGARAGAGGRAGGARGGRAGGARGARREVADLRGGRWQVEGDLTILEAEVDGDVLTSTAYPDPLARSWAAVACATSGDLLLSAAPGSEFVDWGGVAHVGGGAHGSLHSSDSLGPLIFCGTGPAQREERAQWTIADAAPAINRHFGSTAGQS